MRTTTNIGLKVWNVGDENFNSTDLEDNWDALDAHDHTGGANGLKIPLGGLAVGAVDSAALAVGAVDTAAIANLNVTTGKLATGAVTTAKLADAGVTPAKVSALDSARVTIAADTSIANNTLTLLPWTTESFDTGMHDNVTNNGRLTVQVAGKYSVGFHLTAGPGTLAGYQLAELYHMRGVTATLLASESQASVSLSGDTHRFHAQAIMDCLVGDYFTVQYFHNAGGTKTVWASAANFWAYRIGT